MRATPGCTPWAAGAYCTAMVRRVLPITVFACLIAAGVAMLSTTGSGSPARRAPAPAAPAFHTEVFHNTAAVRVPSALRASLLQQQLRLFAPRRLGPGFRRSTVPSVTVPHLQLNGGTCEVDSGGCSLTPCVDPVASAAAPAVTSGGVYVLPSVRVSKPACRHPGAIRISTNTP